MLAVAGCGYRAAWSLPAGRQPARQAACSPAHEDRRLLSSRSPSPRSPAGNRTTTRPPSRRFSSPAIAWLPPRASARRPTRPPPPSAALAAACTAASRLPGPVDEGSAPRPSSSSTSRPMPSSTTARRAAYRLLRAACMQGSRTPQGAFQTPDLQAPARPCDLVDETQRGAVGTALTHGRKTEKGAEPYATRAADRAGRAQGQGSRARLLRRSRRRVLPADPGVGPRQAHRRQHRSACTTTARTATPTARSAAT